MVMIGFACTLARPDFTLSASFNAESGITALFGPSGSGKSTIIRLLAGLERPDHGVISLGEQVLVDTTRKTFVPAHRRRIGLVFQDAQLLPHLSVRGNLTYGRFFTPSGERRIGLDPVVAVLGIEHLLERRPATLSGGERQRVAIGRALLASPRLLLMDEPLASLDQARKVEILPFIEGLRDEFRVPVIYVSHAVDEVARLASRVVRLDQGHVIATGSPADVLAPSGITDTGARFEAISILSAPVRQCLPEYGIVLLDHPAGEIAVAGGDRKPGEILRVAIQASHVTLALGHPSQISIRTHLAGSITAIDRQDGPFALVTMTLRGGQMLKAYATRLALDSLGLDVGDDIHALIKAATIDERSLAPVPS